MSNSPNESELADATEYLKSPEFQRDNSPHSYKQVCTVLAALASAQRDAAIVDWLADTLAADDLDQGEEDFYRYEQLYQKYKKAGMTNRQAVRKSVLERIAAMKATNP